MYFACSAEIFLSEIIVENQKCTISVVFFSVYTSKGFIPFRNRVIPNADHWTHDQSHSFKPEERASLPSMSPF